MRRKISIFILLLFLFLPYARGQERDFGTWYSLELKGELFGLLEYAVIPELRLDANSSRIDDVLGEVELSVPIANNFQFGVFYRHTLSPGEEFTDRSNRFAAFGGVNFKMDRVKISYRAIYEQEYTNFNTSENGKLPEIQHRHKLGLKYSRKKWAVSPFISTELFFTVRPVWDKGEMKSRSSLGFDYKFSKRVDLSLSYKYDRSFLVANPKTTHILSLGLCYELK